MNWSSFVVVGENIHCTRVVKQGGKRTCTAPDGREAVAFSDANGERCLPIPGDWETVSPAFGRGSIKHAALGIWQAMHGSGEDQAAGKDYLRWLARRQIDAGASFLDLNVDEYSTDAAKATEAMAFLVELLAGEYEIPFSIDSSNVNILRAGLASCADQPGRPMVNSVSLEREDAVGLVVDFEADVIVSAAGRQGLPSSLEERIENLTAIVAILDRAGVPRGRMYIDPLVLPVSTDPMNGGNFLDATRQARQQFEGVHLGGGFSNVSFGMPNRKLLNMVFTWLCVEAGADSGIIDPVVMPCTKLAELDPDSEPFKLARGVLTGEDMFGVEYIAAARAGLLG